MTVHFYSIWRIDPKLDHPIDKHVSTNNQDQKAQKSDERVMRRPHIGIHYQIVVTQWWEFKMEVIKSRDKIFEAG